MKTRDEILSSPKVWDYSNRLGRLNSARVKLPDCGTCTVVWGNNEYGMEHVSVSPLKKFRIPSWDDMCDLKDIFFYDEEEAYQVHPKKSDYANIKQNCLHLWRPIGHEIWNFTEKKGERNDQVTSINPNTK